MSTSIFRREASGSAIAGNERERRPLRVGLFVDGSGFAGTERHVLELARGLMQDAIRAMLVCPPVSVLAEHAAREGIPLIGIPKRGPIDPGAIRQLRTLLAAGELDVLHTHNGRTALHAAIAVARAKRGRVVATQHFISPARTQRRGPLGILGRMLHGWAGQHVARYIAVSSAAHAAMISRGESAAKIAVVPNGISEPQVAELASAGAVRQQFGLLPNTLLIVCAARLDPEKDVSTLIQAMALLGESVPNAVAVIAGEGVLAGRLRSEIAAANLGQKVILAGFRSDVLALIRAADLFVLPSLAEPFGLVLIEAMALSRPVIATRAGGPIEIVEDGVTGRLVPPQNPLAMAQAMKALLTAPDALVAMGARGRERFLNKFTTAQMARATLAVYRQGGGVEGGA